MKTIRKYLVALLIGSLPVAASAVPIQLEATSQVTTGPFVFSDFELIFDDTGDGILQWSEITSFSGVTRNGRLFDSIVQVGEVVGLFEFSVDPSRTQIAATTSWGFAIGPAVGSGIGEPAAPGVIWTYNLTPLTVPVPEPDTLLLFILGLAGAITTRRREHRIES